MAGIQMLQAKIVLLKYQRLLHSYMQNCHNYTLVLIFDINVV